MIFITPGRRYRESRPDQRQTGPMTSRLPIMGPCRKSRKKPPPTLQRLAAPPDPEGAWLATLYNARRMLDDIPAIAAAMEAPA